MDHLWWSFDVNVMSIALSLANEDWHRLKLRLVLIDFQHFQSPAVNFDISYHIELNTFLKTAICVLKQSQINLISLDLSIDCLDRIAAGKQIRDDWVFIDSGCYLLDWASRFDVVDVGYLHFVLS